MNDERKRRHVHVSLPQECWMLMRIGREPQNRFAGPGPAGEGARLSLECAEGGDAPLR